MFFSKPIMTSTGHYWEQIERLKTEIQTAEAVVIGAGAGLSAAGFSYAGKRFEEHFSDFHQKYGIADMYSVNCTPCQGHFKFLVPSIFDSCQLLFPCVWTYANAVVLVL